MGRLVPAVTRALDILELFLDGDGTLSAPDIIRKLQLPAHHRARAGDHARRPLVHRARSGQPGRYRLGVRPYQLGSRYAEQLDLAAEGQQVARTVAETCDETVHVAILEGTDVIYIAKVDSTHAVRMVSAAGPSAARALHLRRQDAARLASRAGARPPASPTRPSCVAMTPNSITDPGALREALAEIRERGIAVESRESNPDVSCVAAPVRDRTGPGRRRALHLRADDPLERRARRPSWSSSPPRAPPSCRSASATGAWHEGDGRTRSRCGRSGRTR